MGSIGSPALPPISLPNSWRGRSRRNARTCFRLAWLSTKSLQAFGRSTRLLLRSAPPLRSIRERSQFPAGADPRVIETIRQCLASDPAERPRSALHVAAQLPGGDAISAALADGRVPTPDIVASTPSGSALSPVVAVSALGVVIAGLALIGFRGDILTVAPADVPKPPEVLAERARELLGRLGNDSEALDQEFGFEHVDIGGPRKTVRFVFRSSPALLKPFNLLHIVTRSDPPNDLPGMATVTLNPSGRLLGFSRIVTSPGQPGIEPAWPEVFREANLDFNAFSRAQADQRPLVPHDEVTAWVRGQSDAAPVRVTGATLRRYRSRSRFNRWAARFAIAESSPPVDPG